MTASSSFGRRNVLLLALCQALAMTGTTIVVTSSALVGYSLAEDKALATLPVALQMTATMLTAIPASLLMGRFGRRVGFTTGAAIGAAGGILGAVSIYLGSFALFCLTTMLLGCWNSFAQFFRFAAADSAAPSFKPKAISIVLAGGIAAAIFGPETAKWARDLFAPVMFAGCFAVVTVLCLLAIAVLQATRLPRPTTADHTGPVRPLGQILRQPTFIVAALSGALGYGVMTLVMTATPLAMIACQHSFEDSAFVIQWHALGMFAPSFFTGNLIIRFGVLRVMFTGAVLLALCCVVNLAGTDMVQFWSALVFLGLGWNFVFIGATTLLTETYRPAEKAKIQALNDFLVWGMVAIASFSSGVLHTKWGWAAVNEAMLPAVGIILLATGWLSLRRRPVPDMQAAPKP